MMPENVADYRFPFIKESGRCPQCGGYAEPSVRDDGRKHRYYYRHLPGCWTPSICAKPAEHWWEKDWKREGRPVISTVSPEDAERLTAHLHNFLKRQEAAAAPDGAL